jgi:hypothetical protein
MHISSLCLLKMEVICSSETSFDFRRTVRRCENSKSNRIFEKRVLRTWQGFGNTNRYRITGFFGLFPLSGILENTTFRNLDLFPSSGEGGGEDTYSVGSPPSPEDGSRSSFRNVVFSRIPDDGKVPKPSNSVCYTPSSEPFRIYK